MMGKGIFVTGTDTGIGKTLFTGCLAWKLSQLGFKVAVYKPVQSGGIKKGNRLVSPDIESIRYYSGLNDKDLINLYCFRKESSPHLAAELEKKRIDTGNIKKGYDKLIQNYDYVIVEGAGGLIVPILRDYTIFNLISDLDIAAIVIARSGLGTINHTSLTVRHLKQNKIKLIGVVLNFYKKGLIEQDNRRVIEELNHIPVLGFIPFYNKIVKSRVLDDFEKNIDIKKIIAA